jgi:ribulose-phosphate 3-epimerase
MADIVLIMTVNPGFGGQKLIPGCLSKVETISRIKKEKGYSFLIEVDGGIHGETARLAREAGAEVIVAGSAIFSTQNPAAEMALLRGI